MAKTPELIPARQLAETASKPYPNDSAEYRKARTALLAEEIELRRHIERVAAQRRALPLGGEVPQDYAFVSESGKPVKLSEMFREHRTLVVYNWMYGKKRKQGCPMCTAFLSALDGEARDISQRVALAVVGAAPIDKQLAYKRERGWRHLEFFADDSEAFLRAYRGLTPDGDDSAGLHVFTRDADGTVRHFWGDEMDQDSADPGQDARGPVDVMPMWPIFDLTPDGRGGDWYPKLNYGANAKDHDG